MKKESSQSEVDKQKMVNLSEFDDDNYSVKSDSLAMACLGSKIRLSHKRNFEGLLSKVKGVDVKKFIDEDAPLKVSLTVKEYNILFSPESTKKVLDNFKSTARYYSKNSGFEVYDEKNLEGEPTYINVVDSIRVAGSGALEILFTRSVMPHLEEMKERALILDIRTYSQLNSKYSQKLFELFTDWRAKKVVFTRVDVVLIRKILAIPDSYSSYRIKKQILDPAIENIQDVTKLGVDYTSAKGKTGKAIKYFDFVVTGPGDEEASVVKQEVNENVLINKFEEWGVSDEQFQAIVDMRIEKGKPVIQSALDSFFKIMKKISEDVLTYNFEEVLDMCLNAGYCARLDKAWFIDEVKAGAEIRKRERAHQEQKGLEREARLNIVSEVPAELKSSGVTSPKDLLKKARQKNSD